MEAGFGGDSWSNVSNEDSGTAGWVTVFLGKRWESGYLVSVTAQPGVMPSQ